MTPALIVVTGAPGSGKSTIAGPLAARLGLPLIAKDELKEALWDHLGPGDRELFHAYGRVSYALMFLIARMLLRSRGSAVVEGNFTPEWAQRAGRHRRAGRRDCADAQGSLKTRPRRTVGAAGFTGCTRVRV